MVTAYKVYILYVHVCMLTWLFLFLLHSFAFVWILSLDKSWNKVFNRLLKIFGPSTFPDFQIWPNWMSNWTALWLLHTFICPILKIQSWTTGPLHETKAFTNLTLCITLKQVPHCCHWVNYNEINLLNKPTAHPCALMYNPFILISSRLHNLTSVLFQSACW